MRALARLQDWIELNNLLDDCAGFNCEGGVLCCFVSDERAKSRGAGLTVPASLRASLVSAHDNFAFDKLGVRAPIFKNIAAPNGREPTPAKAATTAMAHHFARIALTHASYVVRVDCAGFLVCMLAALRVRDAQRATLTFNPPGSAAIKGMCYTSKHPKRRAPKPMPVYIPDTYPFFGRWETALRERAHIYSQIKGSPQRSKRILN